MCTNMNKWMDGWMDGWMHQPVAMKLKTCKRQRAEVNFEAGLNVFKSDLEMRMRLKPSK